MPEPIRTMQRSFGFTEGVADETMSHPLDRGAEANELFARALEIPDEDRGDFLVEACGDDRELRVAVERLLRASAEPDDLLETGGALRLAGLTAGAADSLTGSVINDTSDRTKAEKVAASKPFDLVDACFPVKQGPLVGAVEKITDQEVCRELFPYYGDARLAAGAPPTDDIFKCQLKPIDVTDYAVAPTAEQMAQLQATFPDGVCDWSKPGVGFTTDVVTWAVFTGNGEFTGLD